MSLFKERPTPAGRPCLSKLNLANLSKEETEEIQLEKRAALLIHKLRRGKITKFDIKKLIDEEFDQTKKEKFKFFLNKYRKIK